jgi:hypothetical protein
MFPKAIVTTADGVAALSVCSTAALAFPFAQISFQMRAPNTQLKFDKKIISLQWIQIIAMADYYLEYGGGLGDIFYQMFQHGSYHLLNTLQPTDRATVVLITHNPHARELFDYHPQAARIKVINPGYWLPEEDATKRRQFGLPPVRPELPAYAEPIEFYPSPADFKVIGCLTSQPYIVFSVSAGEPERDIPVELVRLLIKQTLHYGFLPVFTGRNYERFSRSEYQPDAEGVCNLIDKLTVAGVAHVLKDAVGLVCCHSSLNILGWLLRKPQLLLYPLTTYQRHIQPRDLWAFGIDYPECRHALFENPEINRIAEQFFSNLAESQPACLSNPVLYDRRQSMKAKTIPLPQDSQEIQLDESLARLTPAHEVKYLCWLARQAAGNVVEIGCNMGLTTRDLAVTNPDTIVYAVDYFGEDFPLATEQRGERPSPQNFCLYARNLPNVVCIHQLSARLNYRALRNVKLIFIDGDHSFEGVRADTEAALAFLRTAGGGWLAWHDYYEGGPDWVGVRRYVDSLELDVSQVENTWLAVAQVHGA